MSAQQKSAFTFGRNWQNFLKSYTPERQQIAQNALLAFLETTDLKGKSFLDIGSGSGIHSAAAWRAGAARVHSFDYDPDSVASTRQLHKHLGAPANWTIEQGSVLDTDFMRKLGTFDVVYSWGVLHHTGDQWQALRNATLCLHDRSLMYIALYAKEAYVNWRYWQETKQFYNKAGYIKKRLMEATYIKNAILDNKWHHIYKLPRIINQYKHSRGMELMTDVRDWLGGWPTEFSSVDEVYTFANDELGLALINLRTGEGNSEFLFAKKDYIEELGFKPFSIRDLPVVLDEDCKLPPLPVWIFGTARGGDIIFDFFSKRNITVAGFIDLEPASDSFHRRPVLALTDFIRSYPASTPIVLANRYVKENSARLRQAGFGSLFNAHPLIMSINNKWMRK